MANAMLNFPPASAASAGPATPPHWDTILSAAQKNNVRANFIRPSFERMRGGREGGRGNIPFVLFSLFVWFFVV